MQQLIESNDMKNIAVDEKYTQLCRLHAEQVEREAKALITGIKTKEDCDRAMAWRLKERTFVESIKTGVLGMARALFKEKVDKLDAEIKAYTKPSADWMPKVKEAVDKWYAAEARRVALLNAKAEAKEEKKAIKEREKKVQTLLDLGNERAAKAEMRKPLDYVPPVVEMPKIENAVFKTVYFVQIRDMEALLGYLAKNPTYHAWFDMEALVSKLETQARILKGNMQDFPGILCTQSKTSIPVDGVNK